MEIALLSIPLRIAGEKIGTVIEEQIRLFGDASDDLQYISDKFESIEAVLVDAEKKQITDERVRLWLSKLKGVALDIEDLVDEWQISSAGSDGDDDESKVRNTWSPFNLAYFKPSALASRREIAVGVKKIRKRLDAILDDRLMSSFERIGSSSLGSETMRPQTSSLVEESEIIGRDEDKETVIGWLVNEEEKDGRRWQQQQQGGFSVTAITGLGGLGKTTLAKQIFNDDKVKDHFKGALYWICVSGVFDKIKLTKDILEAVNGVADASSSTQLNVLQHQLLESLKGKLFLLVLDDVWNEVPYEWEMLRPSLRNGRQGSRILVTTRSKKVAEIMNASFCVHELKGLPDDLSWKLFCSRAFPGKQQEEFSEFESIGREIVRKCKGVPLLIKVMGSTMNTKRTMADWKNILESEMWSLKVVKDEILPALQLSYYNLPSHLKQCFAYCSIYEKDAYMEKNELVQLWLAQGFIRPDGNREVEDIGEEYFNDLLACSMFQEVQQSAGVYIICKMHDLLHDLATVITRDESYIFSASKQSNPQSAGVRHASLSLSKDNASISIASCPAKKLRTLSVNEFDEIRGVHDKLLDQARFLRALVFRKCTQMKVLPKAIGKLKHLRYLGLPLSSIAELPPKVVDKLKHLRYLELSGAKIEKLPDAIGKMKHLRYLGLHFTKIEELPESVGDLVKLHTLNLNYCTRLKNLCGGLCKIVGLRHLYMDGTSVFLPKGFGKLTSLQGLRKFIVGRDEREGGIDELQELNSLQGRLEIKGLDRVSKAEQAMRAQLCKKQYLRELVLNISSKKRDVEDDKEEERKKVIECLRPHPNLQELELHARSVSNLTLPSWIGDRSFSNLTRLRLCGFGRQWELNSTMPGLGKLPALKLLTIDGVGVRELGDEFYYGIGMISSSNGKRRVATFPKLEIFHLLDMGELEEWELTAEEADASKVMPSLRELRVCSCPKLQLLPSHLGVAPLSSSAAALSSSLEIAEESENYCDESKSLPLDAHHVSKPLEHLGIRSCPKLQSLPHSLGQLKKLKALKIMGATELTCLPDSLGLLESLKSLEIVDCFELDLLPESLGGLEKLERLMIRNVKKLESLPDSLGQLESLKSLEIIDCYELESLPESLGGLNKLERLMIQTVKKLESLPDSLGLLESLKDLQIIDCHELESLPESLGGLNKLERLTIKTVKKLKNIPDSLGLLESLEELVVKDRYELVSLPHSFRAL